MKESVAENKVMDSFSFQVVQNIHIKHRRRALFL